MADISGELRNECQVSCNPWGPVSAELLHGHDEGFVVVYCYWPPRAGASAKVKREERPDKEKWKLYEIRIFSFAETYTKALERAKRAENTSNIDTDPEDIKRRVIKKTVKFIFSEEEEADGKVP
ncbi:hypothetical protein Pmani_008189 [Petrolisthes manimaculis]|uniref:Uncharacterized protein n=1 Tax=Petrolisthes manimaculis TaxID=1843537 RepID=A0AAE1Q5X2_9EUCA|nr:hypothetical protein Pmani_008189 [Petrolisthes manimaculis]